MKEPSSRDNGEGAIAMAPASPRGASASTASSHSPSDIPGQHHGQHAFAFFCLENLVEQSGYKYHLRARLSFGNQDATWMDVMMWSVLAGHFELSRALWLKCHEPLRAAIIARRLCLQLGHWQTGGSATALELEEQAIRYEDWAHGMLEQIPESKDAVDLLTCTPGRKHPKNPDRLHSLWDESVLDEATKSNSKGQTACRKFLAHRHCQYVIEQYFFGHYRGSHAAISVRATFKGIILQFLIHVLNLPFQSLKKKSVDKTTGKEYVSIGLFPSIIRVFNPASAFPDLTEGTLHDQHDEDGDDDDDADTDDELDEDYFTSDETPHVTDVAEWKRFWFIPRVKFTMHALFHLGNLVLLGYLIIVPRAYAYDILAPHDLIEIAVYLFFFGRAKEELMQCCSQKPLKYISQYWNVMDVLSLLFMAVAGALRLYSYCEYKGISGELKQMISSGGVVSDADLENAQNRYLNMMTSEQFGHDFLVLAFIVLFLRLFEFMTVLSSFGEVWIMLVSMMSDSIPVVVLMFLVMVLTGISMNAGARGLGHPPFTTSGSTTFADLQTLLTTLQANAASRSSLAATDAAATTTPAVPLNELNTTADVVRSLLLAQPSLRSELCPAAPPPPPEDGPLQGWQLPFAIGFWASLGEFGDVLDNLYSDMSVQTEALESGAGLPPNSIKYRFLWQPIILYVFTFFLTIFLVNLMIAKMTSTYDNIRRETLSYRAEQQVGLIAEFKDERGMPPPINLFVLLFSPLFSRAAEDTTERGYLARMGKAATLRLQAKERTLMFKFHASDTSEKAQTMEARMKDIHEHTSSIEQIKKELLQRLDAKSDVLLQRVNEIEEVLSIRKEELEGPAAAGSGARRGSRRGSTSRG